MTQAPIVQVTNEMFLAMQYMINQQLDEEAILRKLKRYNDNQAEPVSDEQLKSAIEFAKSRKQTKGQEQKPLDMVNMVLSRVTNAMKFAEQRGWQPNGLMAKYIAFNAFQSDVPFEIAEINGMIKIAKALTYESKIDFEMPIRMNVWGLVVGPTASMRKTSSGDISNQISDSTPDIAGSTAEKILEQLFAQTIITQRKCKDEDNHDKHTNCLTQSEIDTIRSDHDSYVIIQETTTAITYSDQRVVPIGTLNIDEAQRWFAGMNNKDYLKNADATFNRLHDCNGFDNGTVTRGVCKAKKNYVNATFKIAEGAFVDSITKEMINSGFFNRLTLVYVPSHKQDPRVLAEPILHKLIREECAKLKKVFDAIHSITFRISNWDIYVEWYDKMNEFLAKNDMINNPAYARTEEHWLKLAAFMALDDCIGDVDENATISIPDEIVIESPHLQSALDCMKTMLLKERELLMTIKDYSPAVRRVKNLISKLRDQGKKQVTLRDIEHILTMKAEDVEQCVLTLQKSGYLTSIPIQRNNPNGTVSKILEL